MNYKYLSDSVVAKIDDDGISRMSCSIENEEFKKWIAEGNTPEPADPPSHNESILKQIADLEATVTQRRLREAIRGNGKAWMDALDDQIAALRSQLQP